MIIQEWKTDKIKQKSHFHLKHSGSLTDGIDISYSVAEKHISMAEVLLLGYGSFTHLYYCQVNKKTLGWWKEKELWILFFIMVLKSPKTKSICPGAVWEGVDSLSDMITKKMVMHH